MRDFGARLAARQKQVVLITGANGFIGRALCAAFVRRGFVVKGAVRETFELPMGVIPVVVGNLDGETNWSDALTGVDVVIHLAARAHVLIESAINPQQEFLKVNAAGTQHLATWAANMDVKRFVYVSSIGVNGLNTEAGRAFTEADVPNPHNAYTLSKWEAERALHRISAESKLEIVILRPPLVYGVAAPGNFAEMLRVIFKGIPLPLASVHNLRSLIYIDNLIDALILCATHSAAAGQTYLVSDGEDISTPDLLRHLGIAMGHPVRLFSFPHKLLSFAAATVGKTEQVKRLTGSLQINSGKIRRELNWIPPYSLQQGLQATAEWYRNTHL